MKKSTLTLSLLLASAAVATTAFAGQGQAVTPATPMGPAIPNVCVLSVPGVMATSAVGQSIDRRMEELRAAVNAELTPEANALTAERNQLQAQANTYNTSHTQPDAAFQSRVQSFEQRAQAFQAKTQLRNAELQQTIQTQRQKLAAQIDPLLPSALAEKNCGLVLDANAVLAGNQTMNLTPIVVSKLNARLTTVSFDRDHIDPRTLNGGAPAAAAAAAPSAPRPAPVRRKK